MRAFRRSRWSVWVRVVPAVLLPAAVVGLSAVPGRVSTASAAMAFVLAVTAAALIGGSGAGLVASFLSFLALNFFFTPPYYTFSVQKPEDLVALGVFLVVSVAVGTLVSRAVSQRARAERREREARLLQHLGTRLLAGDPPERVLESFAEAVTDLLDLTRCEIVLDPDARVAVEAGGGVPVDAVAEEFPMVVHGDRVGTIRTFAAGDRGLTPGERDLIRSFGTQMALAFDSLRLAEVAHDAQLDADRSRLQASLFSSVTHDLRTPLASITASVTSLLAEDADLSPEDRRDHLETISQEAGRLNRLVGNLMDLSRLRAGALVPSKRPTAIDEVIEGVLARMEPVLRGRQLNVLLREDLPAIPADVVQVDQALTNILENAAKFSPPGSPITVQAARWEDTVQVRIADQGRPIPTELRDRVFEPFVRGDEDGAGTGLGLAIARAVVVAHGGTIRIEDAPGGGTAVVFHLPVKDPS